MRSQAGYSLIELLVAAAVMLTVAGGVFGVLGDALGRSSLWNESADLHQRARVAVDVLGSELKAAGAGTTSGPLVRFFPPVEPRLRGGPLSGDAVTVRYAPDDAAWSTLSAELPPGGVAASVDVHDGCPQGSSACGFGPGMTVAVFDTTGNWDIGSVQSVAGATLAIASITGPRAVTYPVGARIAQIAETTISVEPGERQLRRLQAGGNWLPIVDNFIELQLSYLADPMPPTAPVPPLGTANCLFASNGDLIPQPVLQADQGELASLPLSMLEDGPFCGAGPNAFDIDLLRIRAVRATVRLQSGIDGLRGQDPILFARPGSASIRERMLPDAVLSIHIAPLNLQR